jgi:signal transduction histidine kinase
MTSRWAFTLACAGAAAGVASTVESRGVGSPTTWLGDVLVGTILFACGLAVGLVRRQRLAWLLIAAGWAWFLPTLAFLGSLSSPVLIGALLFLHRGVLAHAFLSYPAGSTASRLEWILIIAGYVVSIAPGIWSSPAPTLVSCLAMVALQAVVARRRGANWATRLGTTTACLFWCVVAGISLLRALGPATDVNIALLTSYQAAVGVAALVLTLGVVAGSRAGTGVADMVVELGRDRSSSLEEGLSVALGDPTLRIGYWVAGGRFVDRRGNPFDTEARGDRVLTVVRGPEDEPIAVLRHHRRLLVEPALNEALATATSLSAEHAKLQLELRNRLVETEESRHRLLTAADQERDNLERRLRAGAGTTLDKLGRAIDAALTVASTPATRARVTASAGQLARTTTELTRLARGLSPRSVVEGGLDDALAGLAADSGVSVQLDLTPVETTLEVRACLYFVCSEAFTNVAKHAPGATVRVALRSSSGDIVLTVDDDGPGGATRDSGSGLRGLGDRVETLGGTFIVLSPIGAGTHISVTIKGRSPSTEGSSGLGRHVTREP